MSVSSTSSTQSFAGGQTNLTFNFKILESHPEYVKAKKVLTSSGAITDLEYLTDYTVAVNSGGVGGIVTMTPSVSTAYTVVVYRETSDTQESDYEDYNNAPSDTFEADLDRRTLVSQERNETIERCIRIPLGVSGFSAELPIPSADKYLKINSDADALELDSLTTTTTDYDGTISAGADASKPASPEANDLYFATDTNILYRCATAGSWTPNSTIVLPTSGSLTITNSTGSNLLVIDEDGNATVTGNVDVTGDVTITGDSVITGAIAITGSTTQVGDITLTGDITQTGDLTVSGEINTAGSYTNYGVSAVSGSTVNLGDLHICFGTFDLPSGNPSTQAITNLPFSTTASYIVICSSNESGVETSSNLVAYKDTGAQCTLKGWIASNTEINWLTIGT